MKKWVRLVAIIIVAVITVALFYYVLATKVDCKNKDELIAGNSFTINGTEYSQKQQILYLYIGLDSNDAIKSNGYWFAKTRCDFVALIAVNNIAKTISVLQLNRDSIVKNCVYGSAGSVISIDEEQLALAYSHGDGAETSSINVKRSVSELLYGLKIDNYVTMSMTGLKMFNDIVSEGNGVPVTMDKDYSDYGYLENQTYYLKGDDALDFVRGRQGVEDQTNLARMDRQKLYTYSLFSFAKTISSVDQIATNGYDRLVKPEDHHAITNIKGTDCIDLFNKLKNYTFKGIYTLSGTTSVNEETGFNEFHIDKDDLMEKATNLFYDKK